MNMIPNIEIFPCPINYKNDDFELEEVTSIYNVLVSQGKLKMMFLVEHTNPKDNKRKYETIKCRYLTLHGIDDEKYNGILQIEKISADATIINELFRSSLEPFNLKIKRVVNHNFNHFESSIQGKDFIFEDAIKYEALKDIINEKCSKMMANPKLLQI